MRQLIYISDGKVSDIRGDRFNFFVSFSDSIEDELFKECEHCYFQLCDFEKYIKKTKPSSIRMKFDSQDELEYFIELFSPFVTSIDLVSKFNREFDLTPLEKCSELESVQMYWNTKQSTLWDVKKNTKLKYFEIMDYYKISDLSVLRGSTIEELRLYGCNSLSSFVSKMHVDDLGFILDMPYLRELDLDIIKDESSEYYLNLLSKCHFLTRLYITENFFTFQQYAWLQAHLPNVKEGLDGVYNGGDFYSVIGKRTPKSLDDAKKAEIYQKRYNDFILKYKDRSEPPRDNEKD